MSGLIPDFMTYDEFFGRGQPVARWHECPVSHCPSDKRLAEYAPLCPVHPHKRMVPARD